MKKPLGFLYNEWCWTFKTQMRNPNGPEKDTKFNGVATEMYGEPNLILNMLEWLLYTILIEAEAT